MKLIRYRQHGKEFPGILINNQYYDTSAIIDDYNEHFFQTDGLETLNNFIEFHFDKLDLLPADIILACPVARPSKIVCIGLNYAKYAIEMGLTLPSEPIVFIKSTSTIIGPYDTIIIPKDSKETDWEIELAVVISKKS